MLTKLLGGSPGLVALRLIVISFIVGMILATFGFEPADIVDSFVHMGRRLVESGLSDIRQVGRVLATGALVVLPIWLVLRLLDTRRGG
ncbi:MAG: integrase [Alphaproteobacteria bacterium]|nr:integrase [Alphaproteobacteria bacterium]